MTLYVCELVYCGLFMPAVTSIFIHHNYESIIDLSMSYVLIREARLIVYAMSFYTEQQEVWINKTCTGTYYYINTLHAFTLCSTVTLHAGSTRWTVYYTI